MKTVLQMNKSKILALICNLSTASVRHYEVANGFKRGKASVAAEQEVRAAKQLLCEIGLEATDPEIEQALNW